MLNAIDKLFGDVDYFAERASEVDIKDYRSVVRGDQVAPRDGTEEVAYFCAVPKSRCPSPELAVAILFINCLYEFEGWDKAREPFDHFNRNEWRGYLRDIWIPEYFACHGALTIAHKQVDCIEGLPAADKLYEPAIPAPALHIVRYGMVNAWNSYDYLIETETEYVNFQSWTTA